MLEFDGYRPGCIADVVGMHARYYARDWGFGLRFEAKVAAELAEFLGRLDPERDMLVAAYRDGRAVASVVIDGSDGDPRGAHLRWFIVDAGERGGGLGRTLIARALAFCDARAAPVWLTTFAGLEPARRLYVAHGFALTRESVVDQWSGGVREQLYERPAQIPR